MREAARECTASPPIGIWISIGRADAVELYGAQRHVRPRFMGIKSVIQCVIFGSGRDAMLDI